MNNNALSSNKLFGSLRAEDETEWLPSVFVAPSSFHALLGQRSCLVIGSRGAGRTALCKQMINAVQRDVTGPLVVEWKPSPMQPQGDNRDIYFSVMEQLYDQIARALVQRIGRQPDALTKAAAWVQETAMWFVQSYLRGDKSRLLARLKEDAPSISLPALQMLLEGDFQPVLGSGGPDRLIIAELADLVNRMGWDGVWIVIDGLEHWLPIGIDLLVSALNSLLSTLELFETPGFALKLMAPHALQPAIMQTGAVLRSRLTVTHLVWTQQQLQMVVEKRLAIAGGRDSFSLGDLYDYDVLLGWLNRYGGERPRGWLELLRPLVDAYFASGQSHPLDEMTWERIRQLHPPMLHIDLRQDRVFLGYREIEKIPPTGYQLLRYLYEHPERSCSREELYYRAYQQLPSVPRSHGDENWTLPGRWRSWYDTTILRLREAIEPNARKPVYLITERGKGIALRNAM